MHASPRNLVHCVSHERVVSVDVRLQLRPLGLQCDLCKLWFHSVYIDCGVYTHHELCPELGDIMQPLLLRAIAHVVSFQD